LCLNIIKISEIKKYPIKKYLYIMENNLITEDKVKEILAKILNEEKVSRNEYSRVQFKLDEISNCLSDTIKEVRKLEDTMPMGLKSPIGGKVSGVMGNLNAAYKSVELLKQKVKQLKKVAFAQVVPESKK
jgi:Glu-tRNA(Gln) amidotransferase subunit E-like FAD-binding protein